MTTPFILANDKFHNIIQNKYTCYTERQKDLLFSCASCKAAIFLCAAVRIISIIGKFKRLSI